MCGAVQLHRAIRVIINRSEERVYQGRNHGILPGHRCCLLAALNLCRCVGIVIVRLSSSRPYAHYRHVHPSPSPSHSVTYRSHPRSQHSSRAYPHQSLLTVSQLHPHTDPNSPHALMNLHDQKSFVSHGVQYCGVSQGPCSRPSGIALRGVPRVSSASQTMNHPCWSPFGAPPSFLGTMLASLNRRVAYRRSRSWYASSSSSEVGDRAPSKLRSRSRPRSPLWLAVGTWVGQRGQLHWCMEGVAAVVFGGAGGEEGADFWPNLAKAPPLQLALMKPMWSVGCKCWRTSYQAVEGKKFRLDGGGRLVRRGGLYAHHKPDGRPNEQ